MREAFFGSYYKESFGKGHQDRGRLRRGCCLPDLRRDGYPLASGANFNPFSPFYMDGSQWQIGTNVTWLPVKHLKHRVEVIDNVTNNDDAHRHFDPNCGYPFLANGDAAWLGRMKISRAF